MATTARGLTWLRSRSRKSKKPCLADLGLQAPCHIGVLGLFLFLVVVACGESRQVQPSILVTELCQPSPQGFPAFDEEVAGISVDVFYDTFRKPNSGACLEGRVTPP